MEIKSVHRHIRQKGIGRPAQISIAFRFIYILHREQIGFLPAHQKQVVRGFAAFQLADIQGVGGRKSAPNHRPRGDGL